MSSIYIPRLSFRCILKNRWWICAFMAPLKTSLHSYCVWEFDVCKKQARADNLPHCEVNFVLSGSVYFECSSFHVSSGGLATCFHVFCTYACTCRSPTITCGGIAASISSMSSFDSFTANAPTFDSKFTFFVVPTVRPTRYHQVWKLKPSIRI